MTPKKPVKLFAIAGACAVAIALPTSLAMPGSLLHQAGSDADAAQSAQSGADEAAASEPAPELPVGDVDNALTSADDESLLDEEVPATTEEDSSTVVDMIVQLEDGTDTAAALASINAAVAAAYPDASAEVSREYSNTFTGFALSAPIGSMDAIRGVSGVQSAFLDHETQVSDDGDDTPADAEGTGGADASADSGSAADAESNPMAAMRAAQHGDVLSAQVMMKADKISQTGAGKVVAIIDTGVDMSHPAFSGALHGTPAIDSSKGAALAQQVGKSGTYVSEKFPFAYDYADGDNDASPAGSHGTHVAGITAANGSQITGIAPDAQIIVGKVARGRGGIPDSALLAALDDMAVIKPDVVNMSLGRTAGMDSAADTLFAGVYEKLQEKGITLDVAGGNEFQAGYGNKSGKNLPYASDPDSSTLGEPGSFAPVVTVASIENARNGANGNYKMSDFSSWGVSPDMRLKPEVTAPGGNIYSSVPGGGYQYKSGTSMATPQITGVSAVVLERVQNDPLFSSMSARQKADVVQNLIMGTAVPVADPNAGSGAYYSPRKQGAGLVNVQAATTSSVYPTVNGATDASRPKADLGDGTKGWHFDVTLHNLSGTAATYDLSAQALSENISGGLFTGSSTDWNGKGVSVSFSNNSVTVPAKGEATVGIDVTPGSQFAQWVSANAPSGTFLDGFVRFTARTNGQSDMTVPYLGFYGSWGTPSIFDQMVSEGDGHAASSAIYNGQNGSLLGYNPLVKGKEREGRPNADRYVVSRSTVSGAPTAITPRTGTLRSVHTMTTTYANEAGKSVASFTSTQNWKSVYNSDERRMTWVEENHESRSINLNDYKYSRLPDGKYTLTIAATNDGPSPTKQSLTYNFRVDTKAPVVERATLSNGGSTLNVEISDESPLAGFTVNDPNSGQYIYSDVIRNDADQTYSNGRYHYTATVDMNRVSGGSNNKPYVLAWDYGLNHSKATTIGTATGNDGGNTGDQPGNDGGNGGNVCSPSMGGRWVTDGYRWAWQCNNGAYLRNGWYLIDGRYYYFDGNGYMSSGWVRGRDSWYYLGNDGAMQTGWVKSDGRWYYLGNDGAMQTGWVKSDGRWYYLNNDGAMQTGWVKIGGRWYYLGSDGAMYSGIRTIDGNSYEFSESGEWIK
ncbi:S8 family serine peptidase [uncultured Actinomyces sp.]|uniref:S8 family serine peptidase n=1 Tax=uncultured Actinomyces sp. TaxID=249061 RepID=UPI0028ED5D64|nr:S8 family serine peptidase [uncultured Actinomyces sp.]